MNMRDHIFISYAWEDAALAEWLARKLMTSGYAVWIDRFKLLGGDVWPEDIDDAIKNRSFRMVHLLSRHSLTKENPSKERQLALTIGKSRNERFLIPLNVDGIGPNELPWQLTDIQYVPFEDWVAGLRQLLDTLEGVHCPRPWDGTGQELAVRSYFPSEAVKDKPETLYTNCYKVLHVPQVIHRWKSAVPLNRREADGIANSTWPCYSIDANRALSFDPPPDELLKEFHFTNRGAVCWPSVDEIDAVDSRNVVKNLVRKSLACIARRRGLTFHPGGKYWCFTQKSLDESGNLRFPCYTGKRTYVKACGERRVLAARGKSR